MLERGNRIVEVIVDVHVHDVDRVFHYHDPGTFDRPLQVGDRVLVPFGHRPRVEGYVVGFGDGDPSALKRVSKILDPEPVLSPAAVAVARWMQEHYVCPLVQGLQCFLPPGTRLRSATNARALVKQGFHLADDVDAPTKAVELERTAPKQAAILRLLHSHKAPIAFAEIERALSVSRAPLTALLAKGLVAETQVRVERNPVRANRPRRAPLTLNAEQQRALKRITRAIESSQPDRILLQGVTGSGKTEVYLQAIEFAQRRGLGAILLVPEIALTAQTIAAFEEFFGGELAVLHSRLSLGERYDQWYKIWRGEVKIVVGARSAVFAPVRNLGIVLVDEEHESSYKQGEAPRYHARDVAWARARHEGATLVLGSATPSLELCYARTVGEIECAEMGNRVDDRPLPAVQIVDMREELARGNRSMFSVSLIERLEHAMDRGEQALLFINRRGFASFLLCRECGYVPRCDHCEVSLTFHQPDQLCCHYCDTRKRLPAACPECGGQYLRPFGGGTQRVQEEFAQRFPRARHIRMDVDTTSRKGAHARILSAFSAQSYDVLIGTQMIAKGLHFPNVTVVGVIAADIGLHFPEYRAAERTFQLLTQVAGRAGRGERAGEVVVQTYDPDHYAVRAAARHDYEGFSAQELAYRERANYPPYTTLARCLWSGEDEVEVIQAAQRGSESVGSLPEDERPEVVGPCPAPLSRLKGRFRWHLLLKGNHAQVRRGALHIQESRKWGNALRFAVDVDPVSLL